MFEVSETAKEPILSNSHPDGPSAVGATQPPFDDPELIGWLETAAIAADDKLGQRTEVFFVGGVLGITDWFVVTSARNQRQVRAIVDEVEESVGRIGGPKPIRIEGQDSSNWVLMDYGIFIVHVFTDEARELYDLERLWSDVTRLPLELPSTQAAG